CVRAMQSILARATVRPSQTPGVPPGQRRKRCVCGARQPILPSPSGPTLLFSDFLSGAAEIWEMYGQRNRSDRLPIEERLMSHPVTSPLQVEARENRLVPALHLQRECTARSAHLLTSFRPEAAGGLFP